MRMIAGEAEVPWKYGKSRSSSGAPGLENKTESGTLARICWTVMAETVLRFYETTVDRPALPEQQ